MNPSEMPYTWVWYSPYDTTLDCRIQNDSASIKLSCVVTKTSTNEFISNGDLVIRGAETQGELTPLFL